MKTKKTQRGFAIANFKDDKGVECSIQKSSSAMKDCIWLGANKIELKEFEAGKGWVDRTEFDEHSIEHHFIANTRMHLTRTQVKKLLPILQKFVETGELV
jgi:hypothetical protein